MKTLVVIPTYNEIENIEPMLGAVLRVNKGIEVLVVDDNSPDGTWQYVANKKKSEPKIHLIVRRGKKGLGRAYLKGFKYAIKNGFDYVIQMDCDFSHDPKEISKMLGMVKRYDFVIGSRYVRGGCVKDWTQSRIFLSKLGNFYARLFLGTNIKDWTAGFICWRIGVLKSFNLAGYFPSGYSFQINLKYKAIKSKFTFSETPITFKDRERGETKLGGGIIQEAIVSVIKMRFRREIKD